MAKFNFNNGFASLQNHANTLCNAIDNAAIAVHRATHGTEHSISVAKGDLAKAFQHVLQARELLDNASKVLDNHEKCVQELEKISSK